MIDLRTCKPGDRLLSKHGEILTYLKPLPEEDYYDHLVQYPDGSLGSRIHDGHVYRREEGRLNEDHDIVEIIGQRSKPNSQDSRRRRSTDAGCAENGLSVRKPLPKVSGRSAELRNLPIGKDSYA